MKKKYAFMYQNEGILGGRYSFILYAKQPIEGIYYYRLKYLGNQLEFKIKS